MKNNTMYSQNVYFPDAFKGCKNDCVYCKPSFQRQAKRQKKNCEKCYTFEPHAHLERTKVKLRYKIDGKDVYDYKKTPATQGEQFVFFPKGGDLSFASEDELEELLDFIDQNRQTTFLIQTKNPEFMLNPHNQQFLHDNVIFGITLETNQEVFINFPKFKTYSDVSKATPPALRAHEFLKVNFPRKYVTIEPILQFNLEVLVYWLLAIKPQVIYVGYDTKNCNLPEPSLAETLALIERLEKEGFTVRRKTIRKAWWEHKETQTSLTDSGRKSA